MTALRGVLVRVPRPDARERLLAALDVLIAVLARPKPSQDDTSALADADGWLATQAPPRAGADRVTECRPQRADPMAAGALPQ